MNLAANSELDDVLAVMGQGVREYVALLDGETLRVSKMLGGRNEARMVAEQIVAGAETPPMVLRVADIDSIAVRQGRIVVVAGSSTVVLPMLGRAGIWTSQRRSVVIGEVEGRPVASEFAERLAASAQLPRLEPDRWGGQIAEVRSAVGPSDGVVRIWSPLQSLSRAVFGIGFAVGLIYRMLSDAGFVQGWGLWLFVPLVLLLLLYGLRSLAIGLRADDEQVVVRNLGRTHRIPASSIACLTLDRHRARSVFTDRPLIGICDQRGRVVGAQASISPNPWTARRLVRKADEIAALLGVPNDVTLGGLSDDRLGDDGRPVIRAGSTL